MSSTPVGNRTQERNVPLAEHGYPAFEAAQPMLSQLLKAEPAEREVRSVA